jgi:hypothetical protein
MGLLLTRRLFVWARPQRSALQSPSPNVLVSGLEPELSEENQLLKLARLPFRQTSVCSCKEQMYREYSVRPVSESTTRTVPAHPSDERVLIRLIGSSRDSNLRDLGARFFANWISYVNVVP